MFARRGTRGTIAALLVSALVAGGAFLGGSAASAEELPAAPAASDAEPTAPAPAQEAPAPALAEKTPAPVAETPAPAEAPADAPAESAPTAPQAAEAPAVEVALPAALETVREDGGTLDWGFKSSWRGYIIGAGGTQTPYGGASLNADGTIRFVESSASSFDTSSGTGVIAYTGGVLWDNPAHGIAIALQNPRITVSANGSATVSAEVSTGDTVGASSVARVVVASISATGAASADGTLQRWSAVSGIFASTLAPGGVGRYAGQATDPFTFSTPAAPAKVWSPAVSVTLADGTPLAPGAKVYKGDKLTISGTGFDPAANVGGRGIPIPNTLPQGSYVVFGKFASEWSPADGVASSQRKIGPQGWILAESVLNQIPNDRGYQDTVREQWVPLAEDGSWTVELTLADPKDAATVVGDYGVYTYGAGGVANETQETKLALDYVDTERPKAWSPAVSVTLADGTPLAPGAKVYKGDKLTVRGTGFDPAANVGGRGVPIPNTLPQGSYVVFGKFASEWSPADGVASSQRKVGPQGWVLAESVLNQVPEKYQGIVRSQWVPLAEDGSWTAELTLADPKDADTIVGDYGIYTYGAGGVANKAQEMKLALDYVDTERPKAWSPAVQVFLGDSTTPLTPGATVYKGDKLTVRGTGFDPEANVGGYGNPIPKTLPQGSYVVFGKFAEAWSPADGVASSARKGGPQAWVLAESVLNQVSEPYQTSIRKQWAPLAADGSWTAELTLADPKDAAALDGDYGIYTYAAGGTKNKTQETKLGLNYIDAERPTTTPTFDAKLEVFLADGVTPYAGQEVKEGDELVVKGTGYDPYANRCLPGQLTCDLGGLGNPIPADKPQGTFAVFGHFGENWKPSEGIASDKRQMDRSNRAWALAAETLNADVPAEYREVIRTEWVDLDPAAGSFTWKVKLKEPADLVEGGTFGVYTYAGGVGSKNPAQERMVPVNFKAKDRTPPTDPEPAEGGLNWGIKESFRNYVEGGAGGAIAVSGAAKRAGGTFEFAQIEGGTWDSKTETGSVNYAGGVKFSGHQGALSLSIVDPVVTVESTNRAVLSAKVDGKPVKLIDIDLSKATRTENEGAITWAKAPSSLRAEAVGSFLNFYQAGEAMDPVTFTVGATTDAKPTDPETPKPEPKPSPGPNPAPVTGTQQPGSLTWGISSGFTAYTTSATGSASCPTARKVCADGTITSSGVGGGAGGYVFPQVGSSWNASSQTGTVQYSGVVTFSGHKGLMSESFSNPVITVHSAAAGTLSAGGRSFGLNLSAAGKSVGANGEVTWTGVPVSGSIAGGGSGSSGSGGGSFSADPVTFTVGAVNGANYGSTAVSAPAKQKRTPAATPPSTSGITVLTDAEDLVPGGEIEIEASGFEPDERDILVVMYSDPIVLDEHAGANKSGIVRWIGTIPEDIEPGEHTITLQGSIDVGQVITVLDKKKAAEADKASKKISGDTARIDATQAVSAGLGDTGAPLWVWWSAAIALLLIAGATSGLVIAQRRKASGE